jgi:hypothetical protein
MKGILFNELTGMLSAVQSGLKDLTRRLGGLEYINKEPDRWRYVGNTEESDIPYPADLGKRGVPWFSFVPVNNNSVNWINQPRYSVGEILYVKESWLFCIDDEFLEGMESRLVYRSSIHPDWFVSLKEKHPEYKWSNPMFCGEYDKKNRNEDC